MKPAPATPDYVAFLADVKARVLHASTSAVRTVNCNPKPQRTQRAQSFLGCLSFALSAFFVVESLIL